jgi:hypothetical protein
MIFSINVPICAVAFCIAPVKPPTQPAAHPGLAQLDLAQRRERAPGPGYAHLRHRIGHQRSLARGGTYRRVRDRPAGRVQHTRTPRTEPASRTPRFDSSRLGTWSPGNRHRDEEDEGDEEVADQGCDGSEHSDEDEQRVSGQAALSWIAAARPTLVALAGVFLAKNITV